MHALHTIAHLLYDAHSCVVIYICICMHTYPHKRIFVCIGICVFEIVPACVHMCISLLMYVLV